MSFFRCLNLIDEFYSECLVQKALPRNSALLQEIIIAHASLQQNEKMALRLKILMKWGEHSGVTAQATGLLKGAFLLPFLDSFINDVSGLRLIGLVLIGSAAGLLVARRGLPFFNTPHYYPRKALINHITVKLSRLLDWKPQGQAARENSITVYRLPV